MLTEVMRRSRGDPGIVRLAGISSAARTLFFDFGPFNWNRLVHNKVVLVTVDANRLHDLERLPESLPLRIPSAEACCKDHSAQPVVRGV